MEKFQKWFLTFTSHAVVSSIVLCVSPRKRAIFVHHTPCTYCLPTAPQADTIVKSSPWKGQTNTSGSDRKHRVSMVCSSQPGVAPALLAHTQVQRESQQEDS